MASDSSALLKPRSVAIVGASPSKNRATEVYRNLKRVGFAGEVFPVNPKYSEVYGLQCYTSVTSLPHPVDCAVLTVPARAVPQIIDQCATHGIRAAVVLGSGFREAGPAGEQLESDITAICRKAGILLCGPNCHGIINIVDRVAISAGTLPDPPISGGLALVMQSGVLLGNLIDIFSQRNVGFSYLISSGNEAVIDSSWYLAEIIEDAKTQVVALFVEGIRNATRFEAALHRAAELGKRVLVLKTGSSELGSRAALAHTGSFTGADQIVGAVLRRAGALRVGDLDELVETAILCLNGRKLRRGLGVLTVSGAGCGIVADLAQEAGVDLAELSPETLATLQKTLPDFATPANPLDVTGAVGERPDLFRACLKAFLDDPNVSTIAVALRAGNQPVGQADGQRNAYQEMAEAAAEAARKSAKTIFCFTLAGPAYDGYLMETLSRAGVPFLYGARGMLSAVRHVLFQNDYLVKRARRASSAEVGAKNATTTPVQQLLASFGPDQVLTERKSKQILSVFGIAVPREGLAKSSTEASDLATQIGFPVVVKIESPELAHKTEVGGVRPNLTTRQQVAKAFEEVVASVRQHRPDASITGVLIQEQIPEGLEMIIGGRVDPQFGPVVLVGLGGIYVEVMRDTVLRLAPVKADEARDMLAELRGRRLFEGARNKPRVDVGALAQLVSRFSDLMVECADELDEIDLNPVIVLPESQGVRVVDALIVRRGRPAWLDKAERL